MVKEVQVCQKPETQFLVTTEKPVKGSRGRRLQFLFESPNRDILYHFVIVKMVISAAGIL